MNVLEAPLALFAFLGVVAVLPAWGYYIETYAYDLPAEAQFLATFALPSLLVLFLASWFQPGG